MQPALHASPAPPGTVNPTSSRSSRLRGTRPKAFSVPRNEAAVLDLSPSASTPERFLKQALLSQSGANVCALVGMGGAGKSTILCALGHDSDVWAAYPDGVWFLQLGHDATSAVFWAKIRRMVLRVCSADFARRMSDMLVDCPGEDVVRDVVEEIRELGFLIMIDDAWEHSEVYTLVKVLAVELSGTGGSVRMVVSTRGENVARNPLTNAVVVVEPRVPNGHVAKQILCRYARVALKFLDGLGPDAQRALEEVFLRCAGLPLALAVAGRAIHALMSDIEADEVKQTAWIMFCSSLREDAGVLGDVGSTLHEQGLFACVESSLKIMKLNWPADITISPDRVMRSFSIIRKQSWMPLEVLEHVWTVRAPQAKKILNLFSESSLVTRIMRDGKPGVSIHDVVLDCSGHLASKSDVLGFWDELLLEGYAIRAGAVEERTDKFDFLRPWWNIVSMNDRYLRENLAWHLLRCGRLNEALALLFDFRWIQHVCQHEKGTPFLKSCADLQLLRDHLSAMRWGAGDGDASEETCRNVVEGIEMLIDTMKRCIAPCVQNWKECSFQLHGRVAALKTQSAVLTRFLWSIPMFSGGLWVRPSADVLKSAEGNLKRTFLVDFKVSCIERGVQNDELVLGGINGELVVVDMHTGRTKRAMNGHRQPISAVAVDGKFQDLFSSSWDQSVIVWFNQEQMRAIFPYGDNNNERITCMKLIGKLRLIACGSHEGRIRLLHISTGSLMKELLGHEGKVTALAGSAASELLISASSDCTVRVWNIKGADWFGKTLNGHKDEVSCLALSPDDKLIASGSRDRTVLLWGVDKGEQVCTPLNAHERRINYVFFGSQGESLLSGDQNVIFRWDVRNPQNGVPQTHMFSLESWWVAGLCLSSDGSELFAANDFGREVSVWRVPPRQDDRPKQMPEDSFLGTVSAFGISLDGATMVTWQMGSLREPVRTRRIEIRRVADVTSGVDCILQSFNSEKSHIARQIAVSNDQDLVAYVTGTLRWADFIVHVVQMSSGMVLHELTELKSWVNSLKKVSGEEVDVGGTTSAPKSLKKMSSERYDVEDIVSISFSPDGNTLSIDARVWRFSDDTMITKRLTWDLSNISDLSEDCSSNNYSRPEVSESRSPYLFVQVNKVKVAQMRQGVSEVHICDGTTTYPAGTLDTRPHAWYYSTTARRLWTIGEGGLQYLDLVYDNTEMPTTANQPLLPYIPSAEHVLGEKPRKSSTYTVFISHAGPDKETIALQIHAALEERGIPTFVDREKLRPGDDAPEKMLDAMETVDVMVVILSIEFPARTWTIMELMCVLRRIREAKLRGERPPVVIPVFYRLGLDDCKDKDCTLFDMTDARGRNVFAREGYFRRLVGGGVSIAEVRAALREVTKYTGIENSEGADNGSLPGDVEKRGRLVSRVVQAVVEVEAKLRKHDVEGTG